MGGYLLSTDPASSHQASLARAARAIVNSIVPMEFQRDAIITAGKFVTGLWSDQHEQR